MNNRTGLLFVVSSISGGGKTTVVKKVLDYFNEMTYSISATTRRPRKGEVEGVDYFFLSEEEFVEREKNKYFLEWANVYGCYYGTPKEEIVQKNSKGIDVVLDIDVQGAIKLKQEYPAIMIFLMPPSYNEVKKRLYQRGLDEENVIKKRLNEAKNELKYLNEYKYIVFNDSVDDCFEKVKSIVIAEHALVEKNKEQYETILEDFKANER